MNLKSILACETDRRVDLCGVLLSPGTAQQKQIKDRDETVREVLLQDESGVKATINVWGHELASWFDKFEEKHAAVLLCYRLKLKISPNGKQLQSTNETWFLSLTQPDGVHQREDTLFSQIEAIKGNTADTTATDFVPDQSAVAKELPLTCVKALAWLACVHIHIMHICVYIWQVVQIKACAS